MSEQKARSGHAESGAGFAMPNNGPNLYRIPQRPGYLGGYDWRATVFGLLLLGAVNWAATQYIAAQFGTSPHSELLCFATSDSPYISRSRGSSGAGRIQHPATNAYASPCS